MDATIVEGVDAATTVALIVPIPLTRSKGTITGGTVTPVDSTLPTKAQTAPAKRMDTFPT